MSLKIITRTMTAKERLKLEGFLNAVTFKKKLSQGAENAFVMWAVYLLGLFVLGGIGKWLIEKLFNYRFSLSPEVTLWGVLILTFCTALYAIVSSYFWIRSWGDDSKPLVKKDLDTNNVVQEMLSIKEVKGFKEPERGGIVYFLRNYDGRVFVLPYSDNFRLPPEKRSPFILISTLDNRHALEDLRQVSLLKQHIMSTILRSF